MSDETRVARRERNVIIRQEENSNTEKFFSKFNKVFISGKIEAELEYSHEVQSENFYRTRVIVERKSRTEDLVPIVLSASLMEREKIETSIENKWVEVTGQFRSYNKLGQDGRIHLDLFLFVMTINIYDNEDELEEAKNENLIFLDGYLCRKPVFRKKSSGRCITDVLIAVNRPCGKSDYIPCITWGRNALWVSTFEIGDRVKLYGRVQSREYFKKNSPDSDEGFESKEDLKKSSSDSNEGEYKEAYEISVSEIEKV